MQQSSAIISNIKGDNLATCPPQHPRWWLLPCIRFCKVPSQPQVNQTKGTCMVIIPFLSRRYCFLIRQARNHLCRMMMRRITSLWRASWSVCLSDSFKNTCPQRWAVNYGKLETCLNDRIQIAGISWGEAWNWNKPLFGRSENWSWVIPFLSAGWWCPPQALISPLAAALWTDL